MENRTDELLLTLDTDYGAGADELMSLAQSLRQQLLRTNVEDVKILRQGEAPEGAKAAGVIDWGGLLIALGGSGGVLAGLVGALTSWIKRNQGTKARLKVGSCDIELSGLQFDQAAIQQMLETCLAQTQKDEEPPPETSTTTA